MFDVRNSLAQRLAHRLALGNAALRGRMGNGLPRQMSLWAPLAAVLVVAGCSWFSDNEPTPPAEEPQAKASVPGPGEGEAMQSGEQTAEAQGAAKTPDINTVPTEAPKPSIVNLDQAQQGLGADTGNSQHTDETLTMPNQTAERPGPAPSETPEAQTAEAQPTAPTAPETAPTPPAVNSEAATPPAEPTPAPAAQPEPTPAPPAQVAMTGTPQPGSKPFEPNGPLNLAPGSLARASGEAATGTSMAQASPLPAPSSGPTPAGDNVTVDYSVLGGQQGGPSSSYEAAVAASTMTAPGAAPAASPYAGGQVAGVGQAVGYVYFGNGSSSLSSADRQVLQQVVQLQRVQGGVLRIVGHASARTGNIEALEQEQVNREVSLARATAVARALVDMGVQPMLVQVAAAGDNQTLYAESTPAGEAGNRRAEVYLSQN